MLKKSKTPRKKIKDKLNELTREIVRARFHNKCARCGKHVEGVDSQKAHIKSVGAYPHLQFDLQNMILLCYHCHIGWWHHEPTEAGDWFKKTFPERFKYLEKAKNINPHHSVKDLEEILSVMTENYLQLIEEE